MDSCTIWLRDSIPEEFVSSLKGRFPNVTFEEGMELADDTLARINGVFLTNMLTEEHVAKMPALKWLHGTQGGTGLIGRPYVLDKPIRLSSSRGTHAVPFAEFGIAAIFALAKHLPAAFTAQGEHRWAEDIPDTIEVQESTLAMVGMGAIGTELARKAHAMGMRVIGVRKHPEQQLDFVEKMLPPESLHEALGEADFVVTSLPNSPETKGMIDEAALRAMKPTAFLINVVARNAVTDEAIVAKALREGWIAGACFNVFTGPIGKTADDSPLWDAPNFIISPFLPALDPNKWTRSIELFSDNLAKFLADERMTNEADTSARV
ncbi:MAG: D-2-hydroxyacid dehydrogenase [Dehalococcoidia bacterium]